MVKKVKVILQNALRVNMYSYKLGGNFYFYSNKG